MTRFPLAALAAAAALASATPALALTTGDIAFTAFNADEDGLAFVTLVDIAANTTLYFTDNEWDGVGAFNSGESYTQWTSGTGTIAAGTVVRFSAYDKASLSASAGTLSRMTVSGNSNWGIANSGETVYAYQGSSATAPTTFLTAITNGDFAVDGAIAATGLTQGTNAIRLNANAPTATPDYAEYTGPRTGLTAAGYKALLANPSNWTVDTTNGDYTSTVPNTNAFTIVPVPEGDGLALAMTGLLGLGGMARRKRR